MPGIGLGTFGSDHVSAGEIARAVGEALDMGYRYVDCAACYGNEREVGGALSAAMGRGIPREELFILSKVWNDSHAPKDVVASCKRSLADLRLSYLDCYLVHWPFPNYHAPHCDVDARNPDSRPYIHDEFMATWRAMESLVDAGLVKHIGTSNVTIPKLELILRDARIKPAVNQLELHPSFQQGELFQYLLDRGIVPIGYSPIGSPARPERDRTPDDVTDIEMPAIVSIAKARGVHPAAICVMWAAQRGQVPIPLSTKRANLLANLTAACERSLTAYEMDAIKGCERNCRLIKGQVFLWPGANDWLDLWDADGTIPGWNGYAKGRA
ncbi:MAG: aldo/keto reductase [Clostridiales bacterium]|nr:aldo/keto reductase [Clostridiales bacterium]